MNKHQEEVLIERLQQLGQEYLHTAEEVAEASLANPIGHAYSVALYSLFVRCSMPEDELVTVCQQAVRKACAVREAKARSDAPPTFAQPFAPQTLKYIQATTHHTE